jgi:hypothetical protein
MVSGLNERKRLLLLFSFEEVQLFERREPQRREGAKGALSFFNGRIAHQSLARRLGARKIPNHRDGRGTEFHGVLCISLCLYSYMANCISARNATSRYEFKRRQDFFCVTATRGNFFVILLMHIALDRFTYQTNPTVHF